jgi:hypothetical protein
VYEKKPESALDASEILPREVEGVPVDVIRSRPVLHQLPRDDRLSVLRGGVGVGNTTHPQGTGTLGTVVFDVQTGAPMALTCHHVFVDNPRTAAAVGAAGDVIAQPASGNAADAIGALDRFDRALDCAVATINASRRFGTGAIDIRDNAERIADPLVGMKVVKSGRTTGTTRGTIDGVSADEFTVVPDPGFPAPNGEISLPGDSGSIWSSGGAAVGLHFAGEDNDVVPPLPERARAKPMSRVAQVLRIRVEPWDRAEPAFVHVCAVDSTGRLSHTIRRFGAWLRFGNVEGQAGDRGRLTHAAAATVTRDPPDDAIHDVHLCAVNDAGGLWHTVRNDDGSWLRFGDVEAQAGDRGRITRVAIAAIGGSLHVCATDAAGGLWHTARRPDGSWLPFDDVKARAGNRGRMTQVAIAAVSPDLHVCAVEDGGGLWHTIRRWNGAWEPFGNVESQAGDRGRIASVAAAAINLDLHVCATDSAGGLWHTIRRDDGSWQPFGDVRREAGNRGSIGAVAVGGIFPDLHVCAVDSSGGLWHTIRRQGGSWLSFGNVEQQAGDRGTVTEAAIAVTW